MGRLLLLLFLLVSLNALSQKEVSKRYFSDAIGINIKNYKKRANKAYRLKDYERAQFLFDSLVDKVIKDSYLDNFKVRKLSGKQIELHSFEKPIFLITTANWIATSTGEIPALNNIADNYHSQVDFIVLFWGSKKALKVIRKQYSKHINILFVDEQENINDFTIRSMKHSLGFPTTFIVSEAKQILDVRRNMNHHYEKDFTTSYNEHYQEFMSGLSLLLRVDQSLPQGFISGEISPE